MEIELRGSAFVSTGHGAYAEGKRAIISAIIDADAATEIIVDAGKGGDVTTPVEVVSYSVKDDEGNDLDVDGAYGALLNVTFGLVQIQYQSTGERTIRFDFVSPLGVWDGAARMTAFQTFGTVWAAEPTDLPPPDTDLPGTGLMGRWWQNSDLLGEPVVEVVDVPQVDVDGPGDGDKLPPPEINPQASYSARWTGRIKWPETGQFRLSVISDDGFRVYLEGREVMSYWKENHNERKAGGWLTKTAGQIETIWIEFFSKAQSTSSCDFEWNTPSNPTTWEKPPITVFYPTDGTEAPPEVAERPAQKLWKAEDVDRYD